ncbi:MAG: ferrous iron transport protein B [Candidatus Zixiibacteriota bacterium]|nr:MAG: ferrous iron transport protein B [candidate division Zixibacteria bacterium]
MSGTADKTTSRRTVSVAICGNPNSGKTTLFNAITGLRQKVGNYSGVTVEKVYGHFDLDSRPGVRFTLIDVPGSYSLAAFSPDEYIAARVLFGGIKGETPPDAIVCVIDATNLERGLYLLLQVLQIGCPVVVALNMIDLAERRGLQIDTQTLSDRLGGLPVVPVIGNRARGIDELTQAIGTAAASEQYRTSNWYPEVVRNAIDRLNDDNTRQLRTSAELIRILLDRAGPAEDVFLAEEGLDKKASLESLRAAITEEHRSLSAAETIPLARQAGRIYNDTVGVGRQKGRPVSARIDRVLLHPVAGPVILAVLMTLMFQSIFSWSEPVMDFIDSLFGSLSGYIEGAMSDGPLRSLLTDGIIGGVGSVLVFLPQIVTLFLFISLLEDSGYMPRAAFLVDRIFGWCGLSGKSFIPMLSSFACAIPGIMATRTIEDRKLRLITILVAPLMSCSARLPVYTIMIAAFVPRQTYFGLFNLQGLLLAVLYVLGIIVAVVVSSVLSRLIFKTERASFLMEMPSYKVPTLQSTAIRVYNRAKSFVLRAGTVILAITVLVWALSYYPRSDTISQSFAEQREEIESFYQASLSETETASGQADLRQEHDQALRRLANKEAGEHLRSSYFAHLGRVVEPLFRPMGWDWRITMSIIASFPAREVVIATLGTIFNLGDQTDAAGASLIEKMRQGRWEDGPRAGQALFTLPVALSIVVFFALCCQCGATLVTIRQETHSWLYPVATFVYMTILAYISAMVVYQLVERLGF